MNKARELSRFQKQLATKYIDFSAAPAKALAKVNCAYQWSVDQHFAITRLHKSQAEPVAIALFNGFVYRWEKYYLDKPMVMATAKQREYWEQKSPNRWLRKRIKMIARGAQRFPVAVGRMKSDGLREMEAQIWSLKCIDLARECFNEGLPMADIAEQVQSLADKWGFRPQPPTQDSEPLEGESESDYAFRIEEDAAWFYLARLLNEDWWKSNIEVAYRQFCEHCQIIAGRVRKGASEYLSVAGRADFKARQDAGVLALSQVVAVNQQTGEEVPALDIIAKSPANPEIRRNELMVRCDGFARLAQEFDLVCGFFTFTAPSRFHACTSSKDKKRVFDNEKYLGGNPKQTQKYLSKVWAQARAKLKRMNIHIFGFRVCEPHHDGTPHWHAQFFFRDEDEQAIRFVFADYFTREDRSELHVNRKDFKVWGKSIKDGFVTANEFTPEKESERKHIYSVTKRIGRRFDYKRIEGSATAYLAKYISKNVDGYKLNDDEETGTPADEKAYAVRGWASTWRIRQFQQIGGAPVSVWRELRKMEKMPDEVAEMKAKVAAKLKGEKYASSRKVESFSDLQRQHDSIEQARISAVQGNWSMYIHAMGGIFCARKDHPVKMAYQDAQSRYGEVVSKIKGVTNGFKSIVTRTGEWSFERKLKGDLGFKTGAQRPCGSYNNCTVSITDEEKQEVSNLLRERGEKVSDRIVGELLTFTNTLIEERWAGDVKHVVWGKLKRNVLDLGGNFRLVVWEEKISRNVKYVEPLPVAFDRDPSGKKNATFPILPAINKRAPEQNHFTLTWEEFAENVAKNGRYVEPVGEDIPYGTVYSRLKKGEIAGDSFAGYMNQRKKYNPNEGVEGFESFSDFVKELAPLTAQYEQAVMEWVKNEK